MENNENKYIQETIVSKRKRKWLRRLGTFAFVVLCAVAFGVISRIVFELSGDTINKYFGGETPNRQDVVVNTNKTPTVEPSSTRGVSITEAPTNTPTPTVTPIPTNTPTLVPTAEVVPEPTENPLDTGIISEVTLTPTPVITSTQEIPVETPTPEVTQVADNQVNEVDNSKKNSLIDFYSDVNEVVKKVSPVVVRIDKSYTKMDWFGEKNQYHDTCTGLVLANDGVDILVLTDYATVKDGEHFEVELLDKQLPAVLYSIDGDYGLAVLAVEMSEFSEDELERIQYATISEEADLYTGMPVIALGKVNGYDNSMDLGIITSLGSSISVRDGQVKYYTTGWTENAAASGFVFDTDGFVTGMITHTYRKAGDNMMCCVVLDTVKNTIEHLLNNSRIATAGIIGTDIPKSVAAVAGIENGIYVTSVNANTAAYEIGLVSGDLIVEINDEEIMGIKDLYDFVLSSKPGELIKIKYARYNAEGIKYNTKTAVMNSK